MKKYLILSLLAIALAFSLSTCNNCEEEFPIEDFSDLPNPFRVDSALFFSNTDGFDGWYLFFNQPVDTSSVKGKINLRAIGASVAFTGYFLMPDPSTIFVPYCEIDGPFDPQAAFFVPFPYTLELSGDGDQPILSITGQRLDGNNDATDGGVFSQNNSQGNCGNNYAPTVSPDNGASANLQVQPGKTVDLFFSFNYQRMDTSSFELGKTVFVTDLNNNPVPVTLHWSEDWYFLRITTVQPVEQICTGNFCQINVRFNNEVKSAFGKSLADGGYFFTALIN